MRCEDLIECVGSAAENSPPVAVPATEWHMEKCARCSAVSPHRDMDGDASEQGRRVPSCSRDFMKKRNAVKFSTILQASDFDFFRVYRK